MQYFIVKKEDSYIVRDNKNNILGENLSKEQLNVLIDELENTEDITVKKPRNNSTNIKSLNVEALMTMDLVLCHYVEMTSDCGHKYYIVTISEEPYEYKLYIPDDVTNIGEISLYGGKLQVIGGHNLEIADGMFEHCSCILDLSLFDTSKIKQMAKMFHMSKIPYLDLSSFDTSNVKDMKQMFMGCRASSLDLSSFNTSEVEDMSEMFEMCQAQSLDLSSFNTGKVTNMSHMFAGCGASSLDLSSFDTSKVTAMYCMFQACEAQSIDLSSFNTRKVESMGSMFSWCKTPSLDLTSFDTSNVKRMSNMFKNCKAKVTTTDARIISLLNKM